MYQRASTNGLSRRSPGITLDTDELERELGATDDGAELEVAGTLELLGRELELHAALGPSEQLTPKLLEDDLIEEGAELEEGTELGVTLLDDSPTTFRQVDRAIQLLLFSQPQPLCVVTHNG